MMDHNGIGGIAFDMDGTTAVTEKAVHQDSWMHSMREMVAPIPCKGKVAQRARELRLASIWGRASGRPEPQAVQTMVDLLRVEFGVQSNPVMLTRLRMDYLATLSTPPKPMDQVREILEQCKASKIPAGLCTSSRASVSEWLLNKMNLSQYFKAVVTCDDVEASGHFKPSALPWALVFDRMGIFKSPKKLLVLEDNLAAAIGALEAHPFVHVYLLVSDKAYQHQHFQAQKIQPPEYGSRIQVVTSWAPVLQAVEMCVRLRGGTIVRHQPTLSKKRTEKK